MSFGKPISGNKDSFIKYFDTEDKEIKMSKEDFIYVYFAGSNVTHDLAQIAQSIKDEADFQFSQLPIGSREVNININISKERVGEYLWSNQYNVSDEEAEALAKEHGFSLDEIDWKNRDFECMARGYKRI